MRKNDHSFIHASIVCLYSALLARDLDLSDDSTIKLMLASVLHDIGRVNNSHDASHGDRSVKKAKYFGINFNDKIFKIIAEHSRADSKATSALTLIFKDADLLDRVRTNDLNEDYIRFDQTKKYIQLAKDIRECLSKVID